MSISNSKNITKGVPLGSNLSPILFLLYYINDLPSCLNSSLPALFADDTNLTVCAFTSNEIQENSEIELFKVHMWLLSNRPALMSKKLSIC